MAKSLQEQLMGAGLVDKKKAKAIKQEQRKKKKQQPKGQVQVDENKVRIEEERKAKAEKDRELNKQIQAQAEEKAILAQIKQLIESSKINRGEGEIGYQFVDGTKIRKIYVTDLLQAQLSKGQITIAKLGDDYEIVPNKVADKIEQRDSSAIIRSKTPDDAPAEDDPYADYKIPDDLMW